MEDSEVLIHVGRLSREKNLELIFKALPIIKKKKPNVKLLVVGKGPAKDYVMTTRYRRLCG